MVFLTMRDRRALRDGRESRVLHALISLVPLVSRFAHVIYHRISFVCQPIEHRLQFQAGRFERPVICLTRNPERLSVEE